MAAAQGMDPNAHAQFTMAAPIGRPVDANQYQILLTRMQTQIESFNGLRELGKRFLDTPSSTPAK